jgi:acetyl-CoA carboxylase biotin carboxylase subunit
MIGKLMTYGRTRKIALDRMYRALSEYLIRGIHTNVGLCKSIVVDPAFRQGEATTSYVEEFLKRAPKELFEPK